MLIIPLKENVQKIPVVTICFIVLSCLVFFVFQHNENEGYDDALAFSQASGLLKIEAEAYREYLESTNRALPEEFREDQRSADFFEHIMADDGFQYTLLDHALISPADANYEHWLELRQIFEADLNRVFSRNMGYSPARKNYTALFTATFVHRGFWVLFMNMILLWFVGSLLEIGSGRICLAGYMVAGFMGTLLFGLFFPTAGGPLVGSSAGLAGLVGVYGLIYGRQRLQLVHPLNFAVSYMQVPGWVLLPFWLLCEVILLSTGADGPGAYVAHLGGLLVGLSLGIACLSRKEGGDDASQHYKSKGVDKVDDLLEKIEWQLAVGRRGEARETALKLLKLDPENRKALIHLFNIDKSSPESAEFCATAGSFLGHLAKRKGSSEIEEYFEEYVALCPTASVKPEVLLGVATSYIHTGKTEPASKFLAILLKVAPDHQGLPACLFNLAQMYRAGQRPEQAKKCLRILVSHYPETNSGRKAKELLSPQLHHTFGSEEE